MADTIKITTLATAIAALSVSVTNASGSSVTLAIKDIAAIPEAVNQVDCPILAPRPDNFITDFSVTRDTYGADAALKTVRYRMNYVFYFCPALQGVGIFEKYDDMVTAAAIILNALATNTNLSGAQDILPSGIPSFGMQVDVGGTAFHGCEISLDVAQFMEV